MLSRSSSFVFSHPWRPSFLLFQFHLQFSSMVFEYRTAQKSFASIGCIAVSTASAEGTAKCFPGRAQDIGQRATQNAGIWQCN